jgi:hypothetical protein
MNSVDNKVPLASVNPQPLDAEQTSKMDASPLDAATCDKTSLLTDDELRAFQQHRESLIQRVLDRCHKWAQKPNNKAKAFASQEKDS